jgi:UrcA family protein
MTTQNHAPSLRSHTLALVTALAGCVLSAAAVSSAQAQTPANDVRRVVVKYTDLNLATDEGALALHRRIVSAAREVCPADFSRDLGRLIAVRECQKEAIDRAVADIHDARLAAVHARQAQRG